MKQDRLFRRPVGAFDVGPHDDTRGCIPCGDSAAGLYSHAPLGHWFRGYPSGDYFAGGFRRPVGAYYAGRHDSRGSIPSGDSAAGLYSHAPLGHLSCTMHTIFRTESDPKGRQIIARGFIPWTNITTNQQAPTGRRNIPARHTYYLIVTSPDKKITGFILKPTALETILLRTQPKP